MRRHRWGWRLAAVSPVAVAAGLAVAGLAGAGPALASGATPTPTACPSPGLLGGTLCQAVQSLPSPGAILPSPLASVVSSVTPAVNSVTGVLGSGPGAGGGTGSGGSGSGGSAGNGRSGGRGHGQGTPTGDTPAGPGAGTLSALGAPGWLLGDVPGPQQDGAVPLSFPVSHPSGKTAGQPAATTAVRGVSSLWLVFAVLVACLVGVAGGLGRLENRRREARHSAG